MQGVSISEPNPKLPQKFKKSMEKSMKKKSIEKSRKKSIEKSMDKSILLSKQAKLLDELGNVLDSLKK